MPKTIYILFIIYVELLFSGKWERDHVGDESVNFRGWWNGNIHGSDYTNYLWALVNTIVKHMAALITFE